MLSEAVRAEAAFERAFAANPRSTLIAKRLARIKRAKGAYAEAEAVLQKSLEFNPAAQDIHYDLAMSIIESAPDADQTKADSILYHLRRAFSFGDKNRQAQFWYARQLCITNQFEEARPLFKYLEEASIPFKEKAEVRGVLMQPDGATQQFEGSVTFLRDGYGFVRCDAMNLGAFFSMKDVREPEVPFLALGVSVRFSLGFTLRGPVATSIEL